MKNFRCCDCFSRKSSINTRLIIHIFFAKQSLFFDVGRFVLHIDDVGVVCAITMHKCVDALLQVGDRIYAQNRRVGSGSKWLHHNHIVWQCLFVLQINTVVLGVRRGGTLLVRTSLRHGKRLCLHFDTASLFYHSYTLQFTSVPHYTARMFYRVLSCGRDGAILEC